MGMRFIADLHVHSRHSAATSREADLAGFYRWARIKGVHVVGTGDFTHPEWAKALAEGLEPTGDGLFVLRKELREAEEARLAELRLPPQEVRFLLSAEVSVIYKKGGRVRKVHILVCFDALEKADRYGRRLARYGNIAYDGRPILGLDAKDLLALVREVSAEALFIPAHIWTPWFSLLGSNSGFDSVEECFEDLSSEVTALETGLSSDPAMNWRVSSLDRWPLVSNSDAHSPQNLGREANLFDAELSYGGLWRALRGEGGRFEGTVEFFPEEGKYHHDGHRACGVNLAPEESVRLGGVCPVCGKPLTVGVLHRVLELADRPVGVRPVWARPYESVVPLSVLVREVYGPMSAGRVEATCLEIVRRVGPELFVLREADEEVLRSAGGPLFAAVVRKVREGKVEWVPGYDGEYGRVRILTEEERSFWAEQGTLFGSLPVPPRRGGGRSRKEGSLGSRAGGVVGEEPEAVQEAVLASSGWPLAVLAGPGTGKTRLLVEKARRLVASGGERPERLVCLSFTVRAAAELRERLGMPAAFAGTVHSFALEVLGMAGRRPKVLDAAGQEAVLRVLGMAGDVRKRLREWSLLRARLLPGEYPEEAGLAAYLDWMREHGCLDFDGMVAEAVVLLEGLPEGSGFLRERFGALFVDEFQDLSPLQYRLVRAALGLLGGRGLVIGDPDQSIYAFRGADRRVFERFFADFPSAGRFVLRANYRSSSTVLEAAARLMGRPVLEARRDRPGVVELCELPSEAAEAAFVARKVVELLGGRDMVEAGRLGAGASGSVAVLARTERQLRVVAEALEREGVPWRMRGCMRGLSSESARLMLNLARLYVDAEDPEAALFFADRPEVVRKLEGLRPLGLGPAEFFGRVVSEWNLSGVEEVLSLVGPGDGWEGVMELLRSPEEEAFETSRGGVSEAAVPLLTLHASKGLEFGSVVIVGLNEGTLPLYHDPKALTAEVLEEERRLLYVGITRAAERVVLTRSTADPPSRFLEGLGAVRGRVRRRRKAAEQPELFPGEGG